MKLTEWDRQYIDKLSYMQLLAHWRYASLGDPFFQGETGAYWSKRMAELRDRPDGQERHVKASKDIGW